VVVVTRFTVAKTFFGSPAVYGWVSDANETPQPPSGGFILLKAHKWAELNHTILFSRRERLGYRKLNESLNPRTTTIC
jgi:hypothetical protein